MKKRYGWVKVLTGFLAIVILSGCSTINASIPSTPTPQPVGITFEVIFDENNDCTVLGPTTLPVGEYLFSLDDQSDLNLGLWVVQFHEGKTYQDLLDLQGEPGEYIEQPLWTTHPFYFTEDHEVWTVNLDEAGEHAIVLGSYAPKSVWLCYAFQVTASPSE